jgi:HSP20 family protein
MSISLFRDPFFGDVARWPQEQGSSLEKFAQMLGAVDVCETEKEYCFHADCPGLKKEDIKVRIVDGNVLSISGERKREHEEKDDKRHFHRVERSYGRFTRSFRLADDADATKVRASVEHGVLNVVVPKAAAPPPRTIDVSVH